MSATTETTLLPPPFSKSKWSELLIAYFYTGWAFLIPYLATYLLYAWLKWPVNPEIHDENTKTGIGESWVPCLLHLYWALHAAHVFLGMAALKIWWQKGKKHLANNSLNLSERSPNLDRLWPILPWLLLALIFWIPGVYLEWPSDPWEHLRRINEWRVLDVVTAHSAWMKSSYFIPYSMLSWVVGLRQIFWLDFYYTGICLLLCWQYYRLARVCDLEECASMIFVILQALLFGNSIFSFYRYYGISSSIYAQLGAIALIRLALEIIKRPRRSPWLSFFASPSEHGPSSGFFGTSAAYLLCSISSLVVFVAFNHLQGIGIAVLGIAATIGWRMVEWKRSALWWLIGATVVGNFIFLRFYHLPAIIESCRDVGLLNAWYGFNILDFTSPAGDRTMQIVNAFGVINLIAALLLSRQNHVITWLTILPIIALLAPAIAIPLAQSITQHSGIADVVMFQRMLFAIPPFLAMVYFVSTFDQRSVTKIVRRYFNYLTSVAPSAVSLRNKPPDLLTPPNSILAFTVICICALALTCVPSSSHYYNRTWNTFVVVSNDLKSRDIFLQYEAEKSRLSAKHEPRFIATQAGTALLSSYAPDLIGPDRARRIGLAALEPVTNALAFLEYYEKKIAKSPKPPARPIQQSNDNDSLKIIAEPSTSEPSEWVTLSGQSPQFVSGINFQLTKSTALQQPEGATSHVFTSVLIPIHRQDRYWLEMAIREILNDGATAYLAIAWYDANRNLLESNIAQPMGAGNPNGWINGTYSYFGLIAEIPPPSWTKFGISFGFGEIAEIPTNACFVRVGALLNYNLFPASVIQLTGVRLIEKSAPEIGLAIPNATSIYSPSSQSASLSAHWPTNQVMTDRAGTKEILHSAKILIPILKE